MKKNKIQKNFLNKNVPDSWQCIKDSRNYIYSIILVFFFFVILGMFFEAPESIKEAIREFVKKLIEQTSGLNVWQMIFFIFKNNVLASFMGLILGIFFGIFPVVIAAANGYLLGFVAKISVQQEGILSLWKIFPHGIFELPAVFISLGLGLRLGASLFLLKDKSILKNFILYLKSFVFIVIPLLIIAAVIEGVLVMLFK